MNSFYDMKMKYKYGLLILAAVIVVSSVVFSNRLAKSLSVEENKRVELLAETYKVMSQEEESANLNLILSVLSNNTTIPVLITNSTKDTVIFDRNFRLPRKNADLYLNRKLNKLKETQLPLEIANQDSTLVQYLYYEDSILLKRLELFPYVQLGIIVFFFIIAYLAFAYSKRAEENQVWVGLTKETAHQLGTPISSLMAWNELLKSSGADNALLSEMAKDVERLNPNAE